MNFYKPILLPSNGVPYNELIHLKEPTISLLLYSKSNFLAASENDLVLSILKEYTSIKNPENFYYKDIQYIWFYFINLLNNNTQISVPHTCFNCNNSLTLKIDIAELDLKYASNELRNNYNIDE